MHQAWEVPVIGRAARVLLAVMAAASALADGRSIVVGSSVLPRDTTIGDALHLRVVVKNVSEAPILLLARDANFAVEVQSAKGTQTITSPRYTRRASVFKDDEVPLRPGDSYSRTLPISLNDLHATFGEGWLGEPDNYQIRVRYESDRSSRESSKSVWRGIRVSEWTDMRLHAPDDRQRAQHLKDLEDCVRSEECDAVEVANFYRVVRAERTSDLLLRLIEEKPYSIWLLDAIVFQARPSDATRLRDLATRVDDQYTRKRFIDAALKLEQSPGRRTKALVRP
ncbi:MAG: hypothetical protein QOC81_1295 [Thermoanaerobaculia bacterium]|nr:hypothetical protein [Thermoanaerobaculia bacterium]